MKPFRLNRRALLRGLGATIALPVLDAMLDGRGMLLREAEARTPTQPVRLVTFFFPHGVKHDAWTPAQEGRDFTLSTSLEPLSAHRGDFSVVSGMSNTAARSLISQGGPHGRGTGSFANGMPTYTYGASGPTIEQAAAARLGGETRIRALSVCADPQPGSIEDGSGVLLNFTSWSGAGQPVPAERDPRRLFDRLFGSDTAGAGFVASASVQRSILDGALAEVNTLRGRVGARDRARLDEHLTAIREMEREVTASPATCARPAMPAGDLAVSPERVQLMLRLVATALRCDLTRFVAFSMSNGIDAAPLPWLGLSTPHHSLSHEDHHDDIVRIVRYEMEQVAFFFSLLKADREGDGTVFDHSLLFVSSEVADGATHSQEDLPVIVAGRASGCLRPGAHLRQPLGTPISNLFLTLLNIVGAPVTSFGLDGATMVDGLMA